MHGSMELEYVECHICKASLLKQVYRKHLNEHGISSCRGCEKQFLYGKRLRDHIEKSTKCKEAYRENQLDLPSMKTENNRKKRESMDNKKYIKTGNSQTSEIKNETGFRGYHCPSCGEDLLKPEIDLVWHKSGKCLSEGFSDYHASSSLVQNGDQSIIRETRMEEPNRDHNEVPQESPNKNLSDTLSEDINYDEDDPMSEESKIEQSFDEEPVAKKPKFSGEFVKNEEVVTRNEVPEHIEDEPRVYEHFEKKDQNDINSSSDRIDEEVTLEERNPGKAESKEGKKKIPLELKIQTIKRIEEEGVNNLKEVAANIGIKVGVVHKWWMRKEKLQILHSLQMKKNMLITQENITNSEAEPKEYESSPTDQGLGSTDKVLDDLQQGLNEIQNNGDYANIKEFDGAFRSSPILTNQQTNLYDNNHAVNHDSLRSSSISQSNYSVEMPVQKTKSRPCGMCTGCKTQECAKCRNCLDKPKFGGRNVIKQRCTQKVCEKQEEVKKKKSREAEHRRKELKKLGQKRMLDGVESIELEGNATINPDIEDEYNKVVNQQYQENWMNYQQGNYNLQNAYYSNVENYESLPTKPNEDSVKYEVDNKMGDALRADEYQDTTGTNNIERDATISVSEVVNPVSNSSAVVMSNDRQRESGKQNTGDVYNSEDGSFFSGNAGNNGHLQTKNVSDDMHGSVNEEHNTFRNPKLDNSVHSFNGNSYSFGYSQPPYIEEEISNKSEEMPFHQNQSVEKSTYGYENIYGYGTQLQFDSKKNRNSADAGQKLKRKTRLPRCKTCPECKAPDCGTCRMCLDMVRFGGPGKLRKSCIQKGKCTGQGNASNGLKTSSPELKEHSPKQSQYLLSSFIGSNSNLVKRSNPVEGNAVPGHSEEHLNKNTSLGKLMDYVKTHEVSNGGSDKPDVPEENEPDRRELENALGSIGAEPNNDWMNNSGLVMPRSSEVGYHVPGFGGTPQDSGASERQVDESDVGKDTNGIRLPAGLEVTSSKKSSQEIFFANEVTITKKVRKNDSSRERSNLVNTSTAAVTSSWPQTASSQQYSVASNQHPSLAQSGVSITKKGQGESDLQKKKQKQKEFKINQILSKLNPVPVSSSVNQNSTQLNITAKDLNPKAVPLFPENYMQDFPKNSQIDGSYQSSHQVPTNTSQGYYNNYPYYQDTTPTQPYQYSNQGFPSTSYPVYPIAYGPPQATTTEPSKNNTQQPAGFEDYINSEEANSIQDLLLNDTMNKINNQELVTDIKVEVDDDAVPSSTNQTVINFQNSISETLPNVPSTESREYTSQPETTSTMAQQFNHSGQTLPDVGNISSTKESKIGEAKSISPNHVPAVAKKDDISNFNTGKSLKLRSENIVTLFPTDMEEGSRDGLDGINLTKTYTISKPQIDAFRTISWAVINNEMTTKEAGKRSGLDEEIIKAWVESYEDHRMYNKEVVEKARKYDELKKNIGDLNRKIADLQNMVLLSAIVKKEAVTDQPSFTPLAENIPVDLSVKIPHKDQQQFTNVSQMLNKMFT